MGSEALYLPEIKFSVFPTLIAKSFSLSATFGHRRAQPSLLEIEAIM